MLHAINKHKTRLHHRYLGHREDGERRVHSEDEITALLLGPLDFMPVEASAAFWLHLIRHGGCAHLVPAQPPQRISMDFWPRKGQIEPDLLVTLDWLREQRLLLVELKWQSGLSGERQLHEQWLDYLSPEQQAIALHLFIAPDISAGRAARASEDVWGERLVLLSWMDVLNSLHLLPQPGAALLEKWRAQLVGCLARLGIEPFHGFSQFSNAPATGEHGFWFPHGKTPNREEGSET